MLSNSRTFRLRFFTSILDSQTWLSSKKYDSSFSIFDDLLYHYNLIVNFLFIQSIVTKFNIHWKSFLNHRNSVNTFTINMVAGKGLFRTYGAVVMYLCIWTKANLSSLFVCLRMRVSFLNTYTLMCVKRQWWFRRLLLHMPHKTSFSTSRF